ncbi:dTMP kinase [Occultella aeris]|uniref:Thymidylate kinase n=1 Tax=Occultella aeris TaxID=2761496 RepID=A0A7M4DHS7_9MICO|nr:Thymidylate kinase [Occultella aeris]
MAAQVVGRCTWSAPSVGVVRLQDVTGLFISFEGGDGAGKSTQLGLLADSLAAGGVREVVRTREPGGTELGRTLRDLLLHGSDLDPRTEALLFAADRAHHVASLIRPALARGAAVLTDRYLDSSVAYQAGGRTLPADDVERLSLWATQELLPDLTVLLDLDPARLGERLTDAPDRLESAGSEFHARTRQAFLDRAAAEPDRWLVLDATRPRADLAAQIRSRVDALLTAATATQESMDDPSGSSDERSVHK